jgi:hypothetical protein
MNDERATRRRLAGVDGGSGVKVLQVQGLEENDPSPAYGTGYSGGYGTYVMG